MKKIFKRKFNEQKLLLIFILAFAIIGAAILTFSKAATPVNNAPNNTAATGTSSFRLTPSSGSYPINTNFTVGVYVNTTDSINTVDPQIAYDATKLDFVSISTTGNVFPTCLQNSGGNGIVQINCGVSGSTVTGNNLKVADVTFKARVGSGTTNLSFAANSFIFKGDAINVWDGVTTGGTYTLTGSGGTGGSGGAGGGSGGTGSSGGRGGSDGSSGSSSGTAPAPSNKTTTVNPKPTNTSGGTSQVATTTPTNTSSGQQTAGYYVSVVVTDDQAKAVAGAEVVLDGIKSTTDAAGVASFVNISAGEHKVKVSSSKGSYSASINVTASSNGSIQQFPVKVKKTNGYLIYIVAGAGVLIAGAVVLAVLRQRALKRLYGSYHSSGEMATVVTSAGSTVSPSSAVSTATPATSPTTKIGRASCRERV